MPLVMVGTPAASTKRSAATSAWSAQTSVPRISTGRLAPAEERSDLVELVGVGLAPRVWPSTGAGPAGGVEELVHRDVDEDRAAVAGAGCGEGVVHAAEDVAGGVQRAGQLRDRLDDRGLVELLQAAAAPTVGRCASADDHHRRAGELGLRDRADAVGDAGAGGQHGEAGDPGQLAGGLGGEGGRLLVTHVEQPHRRVGGDGSVVHREDVGAAEGEEGLDPMGPGGGNRELAGVTTHLGRGGAVEIGIGGGGGIRCAHVRRLLITRSVR